MELEAGLEGAALEGAFQNAIRPRVQAVIDRIAKHCGGNDPTKAFSMLHYWKSIQHEYPEDVQYEMNSIFVKTFLDSGLPHAPEVFVVRSGVEENPEAPENTPYPEVVTAAPPPIVTTTAPDRSPNGPVLVRTVAPVEAPPAPIEMDDYARLKSTLMSGRHITPFAPWGVPRTIY